jgi:hypothetical protein
VVGHTPTLLAPLGSEARKRERVRCSSLVDWPIYPRLKGTMQGSKGGRNAGPRGQLGRLVQMAAKIRRLARNSKLGDDGPVTSLGNPYRRVRVGTRGGLLTMVVSNLTETEDTIP